MLMDLKFLILTKSFFLTKTTSRQGFGPRRANTSRYCVSQTGPKFAMRPQKNVYTFFLQSSKLMSNTLYFSFSLILHNIFALNSIQEWLNKVLLYIQSSD